MHRKAVRISTAAGDVDVPLGVFAAGQVAQYDGTQFKGVAAPTSVPGTTVVGDIVTWNNVTGTALADPGILAANLVQGPASVATIGNLAAYSSLTGKALLDSTIVAGSVGRNAAFGIGASVVGNILSFNNTTGNGFSDSGVSATAHAARHIPGGADTAFPGTYSANDVAKWTGSAFAPALNAIAEVSTLQAILGATSTTLQAITALSISLPRAGTYWLEAMLMVNSSLTTATLAFGLNSSTAPTRMRLGWQNFTNVGTFVAGAQSASVAVGGAGVVAGVRAVTTLLQVTMSGSITIPSASTVQLLASTGTNPSTLNIDVSSSFVAVQK